MKKSSRFGGKKGKKSHVVNRKRVYLEALEPCLLLSADGLTDGGLAALLEGDREKEQGLIQRNKPPACRWYEQWLCQ